MAQEAYDWYEKEQAGVGEIFLKELYGCIDKIEAWPTVYAKVKDEYRQINLKRFPYVVLFRIIQNDIVVYAVFHTSRSPRKKYKRNS
ncbi:type II toxin-antitoxin system RelE/ParE family toxin [Mucilaginibacter mali]|uniref:Type II toxin-antitoxin system RelE/ParE family toxin n=1 Tax=Mucilaginibacter mali TaxID=2740462 RepID=A0A7D4U9R0_9SPHI|nr:type II toxin-antitoxin system RelE/ParE family toxin [Mucilaginibacter mali]QKJ29278.1 type II toxin-antitoxin system RelE/ParE family toxin [Mucilaginibacter mali]